MVLFCETFRKMNRVEPSPHPQNTVVHSTSGDDDDDNDISICQCIDILECVWDLFKCIVCDDDD